jgi:hypothetical protein
MTVDEWLASVDGVAIDMDGAYGAQCWDLWSNYAQRVWGLTQSATMTTQGTHAGFACSIFHDPSKVTESFQIVPASQPSVKGDVPFWEFGSVSYPLSHVAVTIEDRGENLWCMTQNPGASSQKVLTKAGLLGYLRPFTHEEPQLGENMLIRIQAPNRGIALIGPNYFRSIHNEEELWASSDLITKHLTGNDRQFDVWKSLATQPSK